MGSGNVLSWKGPTGIYSIPWPCTDNSPVPVCHGMDTPSPREPCRCQNSPSPAGVIHFFFFLFKYLLAPLGESKARATAGAAARALGALRGVDCPQQPPWHCPGSARIPWEQQHLQTCPQHPGIPGGNQGPQRDAGTPEGCREA